MSSTEPSPTGLLKRMRVATRRAHNIANVLILSKLVLVVTDTRLYGRALSCFYPVYTKLEQLLPLHKDHPALAPVYRVVAGLQRSAAMRADLAYLLGTGWEQQLERSAAAEAYAAHLQQLSDTSPHLLLPYAFSLYVPILLGFMGQRLRRSLALPPDGTKGLAFFQVEDAGKVLAALRAAVDEGGAALTPEQQEGCVAEAVQQFRHNNSVVAEFKVGAGAWRAAAARGLAMVPARWLLGGLLVLLAALAAARVRGLGLAAAVSAPAT